MRSPRTRSSAARSRCSAARILCAVRRRPGTASPPSIANATSDPKPGIARALGPGDAEGRAAQRERAEGRVGAGHVHAHSRDPPRGRIRAVGRAEQQDGGEHVRLVARQAEHAVERLVAQMIGHGEDEPRVGEEQL